LISTKFLVLRAQAPPVLAHCGTDSDQARNWPALYFTKRTHSKWCVLIVFSDETMVNVSREIRRARAEDLIDI
jgi:hypothetical protein